MKKILPICFALSLVTACSGCVGDSGDTDYSDSAEDATQVSRDEDKASVQNESSDSSFKDELVNFPKEKIKKLIPFKELKREHPDGEPFWPTLVEYVDDTLYVYDDSTQTILQYDDNFVQKGPEADISIDIPDDNILSMSIDENKNIILCGSKFIHIVGNQYIKLRNVYDIKSLVAFNNKIYSYNYSRKAGTYEYAFNVYDYNLKYLGAEAVNPFVNELYRFLYEKYVCGGNNIYFTVNSASRISVFNMAHGYPKAPAAVRTFSFEEELQPYIDKKDEWAAQPPPPGMSPRKRQIVTGMCFLDGRLYIMLGWGYEIRIGKFDEDDRIEYIYYIRCKDGNAFDITARKHESTTYFYLPITSENEGRVHIYKCESR